MDALFILFILHSITRIYLYFLNTLIRNFVNDFRHVGFVSLLLCGSELVATESVLWFARKPNCPVTSRTPADFI